MALPAARLPACEPTPAPADPRTVREQARRLTTSRAATAAERQAVIAELARQPSPESATLIAAVGLAAAEPGPRSDARAALVAMSADARIRGHLLTALKREGKRPGGLAAELALVMLAADEAAAPGGFRRTFGGLAPADAVRTCAGVLAAAATGGDTAALEAVRGVAATPCFAGSLACRREVVATLAGLRDAAAVAVLVDLLPTIRGEARGDAVEYLARVSGEDLGDAPQAWRQWLDAHHEAIDFDRRPPDRGDASTSAGGQPAYYDIPIYAERVVFVIDTSGSMAGPRLDAAKRELQSAVFRLPEATLFALLFFNARVGAWQSRLLPATEPNKRAAAVFLQQLAPGGGTATSDAIEAAFGFDAEAIFLLSDGAPTAGRVVAPAAIVEHVSRLNDGRGVSVHAISITAPEEVGPAAFLEALARANRGKFRAVHDAP